MYDGAPNIYGKTETILYKIQDVRPQIFIYLELLKADNTFICESLKTSSESTDFLLTLKAPNKKVQQTTFKILFLSFKKKIRLDFCLAENSLETSSFIFSEKQ